MGLTVDLEDIFCEVADEGLIRRAKHLFNSREDFTSVLYRTIAIPPGPTREGVPADAYHSYRRGLASACADVVLVAIRDGVPQVPLIRREPPPFGGCWWVMGGVVPNFRPVQQFLLYKAYKECGLTTDTFPDFVANCQLLDTASSYDDLHIVGCLGTYRTAAEDTTDPARVCDTINVGYLGLYLGSRELHYDSDHTDVRWVTLNSLNSDPCGHWYPEHLARRALGIVNKCVMK